MKVWYKISELRKLVGIITDYYCEYIELKDIRTGEYHLIHESKITFINKNKNNEKINFIISINRGFNVM